MSNFSKTSNGRDRLLTLFLFSQDDDNTWECEDDVDALNCREQVNAFLAEVDKQADPKTDNEPEITVSPTNGSQVRFFRVPPPLVIVAIKSMDYGRED
jgi:hypothetical protein